MNAMLPHKLPDTIMDVEADGDDDLLALMQEDDTEAYRKLVQRHIDRAYALALRILRNAADAEDITQEAFVKAWIRRHDWQSGRAKFSTWMYRVIMNACIDHLRGPRNECLDDVPEPQDTTIDVVADLHRREVFAKLDEAMQKLPIQQRAVIALSYHENMSSKDIAEVMGSSISAIDSLLKRGRQRLRDLLKRSENDVRSILV